MENAPGHLAQGAGYLMKSQQQGLGLQPQLLLQPQPQLLPQPQPQLLPQPQPQLLPQPPQLPPPQQQQMRMMMRMIQQQLPLLPNMRTNTSL